MADPRLGLLLALGDDELVLGHRHSEWTGWAPHIEEDLAFSSIAQDEMAHARLLYGLVRELDGRGEDELALGRQPDEYRNAVLCERPNRDWGYSIARQYLYDTADAVRLEALAESSWRELADVVAVIRLEEEYHLDHARAWFTRLAVPGIARRDGRWVHEGEFAGAGGRHGRHSEDFLPLWEEMTKLHREHPGATW